MILLDLVYVNSPGGLTLSKLLIDHINENSMCDNIELLIDKRNFKYFLKKNINYTIISKSEISRYSFYKKNNKRFGSILCFANIPPPLKIDKNVFVYFHNELLLKNRNLSFPFFKKLEFKLKKIYIKSRNFNYSWIVQTNHMKDLLSKSISVNYNQIYKYPIFNNLRIDSVKKSLNSFIYPTSWQPHKNNLRLIRAFIKAAKKTPQKISLTLTLDQINIDLPNNLKTNFLIFPSLKESFGLPLIEGIQANCKVLASDLNFVNELIIPSYSFNPLNENEMSQVILLALNNKKHKKSIIKTKNSLDSVFKKLFDVQQ